MPHRSQELSLLCRISLLRQHQDPDYDLELPFSKSNARFPEHLIWFPWTYLRTGCYITYKSVVECSTLHVSSTAKLWHDCCEENYAIHDLKYFTFEIEKNWNWNWKRRKVGCEIYLFQLYRSMTEMHPSRICRRCHTFISDGKYIPSRC